MKTGLIGIVGDDAKQDFWGTMQRVAEVGYQGVEAVDHALMQGDVKENLARFRGLGLELLTVSANQDQLRDDLDGVVRRAVAVESPRVSVWWSKADSKENLLRDAELYNTAGARLAAEGIKLCYHNHQQEFRNRFDGVYALDWLAANTDPKALYFNIDIAWVTYGDEDPVRVLRRLAGRVPAIHVKDMVSMDEPPAFTAVGTGIVNIPDAVHAADETGVEWMIVEQDRLRHLSAMETITLSYLYLKECGLTD